MESQHQYSVHREWHYHFLFGIIKSGKVSLITLLFYPWILAKVDQALNGFIRVIPFLVSVLIYVSVYKLNIDRNVVNSHVKDLIARSLF